MRGSVLLSPLLCLLFFCALACCAPNSPTTDLCKAMRNVSDQINFQINSSPLLAGSLTCSRSQDCVGVKCTQADGSGTYSITLSCSPVGVTLKMVNTSTSPPQTESQLFRESGMFLDYYQVTVDQKNSTAFGFALRLHEEDDDFSFDMPLVNHTFIPTTTCGTIPTSAPTKPTKAPPTTSAVTPPTETPHPVSTVTAHSDSPTGSTGSPRTDQSGTGSTPGGSTVSPQTDHSGSGSTPGGSTGSPQTDHSGSGSTPGGSTGPTGTVPPVTGTTCDAMENIANQMESNFLGQYTCSRKGCSTVSCVTRTNIALNLYLSCSPVGMTLETVVNSRVQNKTLFTRRGIFDKDLNVTVHNYDDKVLGFALLLFEPVVILLAKYTLIPLDYCDGGSNSKGGSNSVVIGVAVAVPLILLLSLVAIVVVITVVYLVRRRRYRYYQLHQAATGKVDSDQV